MSAVLLIVAVAIVIVMLAGIQILALCRAAAKPTPPLGRPVGEDEESW